ncbi:3-hexulose-6-phosphate synthase [Fictibacillus terranigra]|uniref:3-hexulose-6-phosphate synthase n=1 Tax=Fictibacillus terranigra TaxID=3058424 RepID=A0ABT8E1Q5_9BACL|nr:3-hexulose-6-phosphate synthase [Fictibacillus sp. CENA-BCM004]MDN4071844.1 3-hexulose-6-phosphate synthase [Fictibacillus sp. CENA-BCM004]
MNIQLALDRLSIEEALSIADRVEPYIDWIEVGTSLIKEFGMESVRLLKEAFPHIMIVADCKTFDNAVYEFELCFSAGADVATVLGTAPAVSIEACMETAKKHGKQVMVDLLNASEEQIQMCSQFEEAILCSHVSKDEQEMRGQKGRLHIPSFSNRLAMAGGISIDSFCEIKKHSPYVAIIGSSITKADDPALAAKTFYEMAKQQKEKACE